MQTITNKCKPYHCDLISQLALADSNYLRLTKLIGDLDAFSQLTLHWSAPPPTQSTPCYLTLKLLERFKYTLTLQLQLEQGMPWHTTPMTIRIYRDMRMADVVSGTLGHQFKVKYDYPNNQGYLVNEKTKHNQHLAKILQHALSEGIALQKETPNPV